MRIAGVKSLVRTFFTWEVFNILASEVAGVGKLPKSPHNDFYKSMSLNVMSSIQDGSWYPIICIARRVGM